MALDAVLAELERGEDPGAAVPEQRIADRQGGVGAGRDDDDGREGEELREVVQRQ